jgi:hypothetical protein
MHSNFRLQRINYFRVLQEGAAGQGASLYQLKAIQLDKKF